VAVTSAAPITTDFSAGTATTHSTRPVGFGKLAAGRTRAAGFVEALTTDASAALMVALIQQLYHVEHAAADLDPDARAEENAAATAA